MISKRFLVLLGVFIILSISIFVYALPSSNIISPSNNLFTNTPSNNFLCNATDVGTPLNNLTLNIWNSTNSLNKTFTEGNVSNHYVFDGGAGNEKFITIGSLSSNPFNFSITKNLTITFWFKINGVSSATYIDSPLVEIVSTQGHSLIVGVKNKLKAGTLRSDFSTVDLVSGTSTISNSTWYFGSVVYSNQNTSIYVNGVLENSSNLTNFGASVGDRNKFGFEEALDANPFNGSLDEIRVYNSTLNSTQITTLYNMGRLNESLGEITTNLRGLYHFNNMNSVNDSSGNGNNEVISLSSSNRPDFLSLIDLNNSQTFSYDDNFTWNCLAYNNDSNYAWATSNYTFTIDTTNPLISYGTNTENNNTNFSRNWIFVNVSITETNFQNVTFYLYNTSLVNSTTYTDSIRSINFTNLANGLYYYNATTYDQASNSNSTETRWIRLDTTGPSITRISPLAQYYSTNESLNLNYTVSDAILSVSQCWFKIINSTSSIIINNQSLSNCQNTTFDVPRDDTYTLTIYSNDTVNNLGIDSVTFGVSTVAPTIVLDYPSNNSFFSTAQNINVNFTATDSDGISQCRLYSNFSGIWGINETFNSVTSGVQVNTKKNLTDNNYLWNVWCNDTVGNSIFALNNLTFTIDTIIPSISILVSTTAGSQTISFNATITDTNPNICKYTIFNSSNGIDGLNNNITFTCNSNPQSATVTSFATYTLQIYANDSAGNQKFTNQSFTTSETSGGTVGGGGGGGESNYVNVIAIVNPAGYTKLLSKLDRAKIYARTRESCEQNSQINPCELNDDLKLKVIENLKFQNVNLELEEFNLFFDNYNENKIEEVKVLESESDEFDLFKALIQIIPSPLSISPKVLDPIFIITSKDSRFEKIITSNKPLKEVSLVEGETGFSVNLRSSTTALIVYEVQNTDFTARTIKGKVNYISDEGESVFQDIQIRAFYIFSPTLLIIFGGLGVTGVFIFIFTKKKRFKVKNSDLFK